MSVNADALNRLKKKFESFLEESYGLPGDRVPRSRPCDEGCEKNAQGAIQHGADQEIDSAFRGVRTSGEILGQGKTLRDIT